MHFHLTTLQNDKNTTCLMKQETRNGTRAYHNQANKTLIMLSLWSEDEILDTSINSREKYYVILIDLPGVHPYAYSPTSTEHCLQPMHIVMTALSYQNRA